MTKRILVPLILSCSIVAAADSPPSEASVKELLDVMQVHKMLDATMVQMDGFIQQTMQQVTQGQTITPDAQKEIDKRRTEALSKMKEVLDWSKLEPVYVRVYQKSFTQPEIDGLIAMYKTPAGQTLLTKMPVVMQNTMSEMQQLLQPVMQQVQQTQREMMTKLRSQKPKNGG